MGYILASPRAAVLGWLAGRGQAPSRHRHTVVGEQLGQAVRDVPARSDDLLPELPSSALYASMPSQLITENQDASRLGAD
jgi:hypothetical protein